MSPRGAALADLTAPHASVLRGEPRDVDVREIVRGDLPPADQVLDARTAQRVAVLGGLIAALSLAAGVYARQMGRPWRSTIFLALVRAPNLPSQSRCGRSTLTGSATR